MKEITIYKQELVSLRHTCYFSIEVLESSWRDTGLIDSHLIQALHQFLLLAGSEEGHFDSWEFDKEQYYTAGALDANVQTKTSITSYCFVRWLNNCRLERVNKAETVLCVLESLQD